MGWRSAWLLWILLVWPGNALLAGEAVNDLRDWRAQAGPRALDGLWQLQWVEPERASQQVRLPFSWQDGTPVFWGEVGFGQIELSTTLLLPVDSAPLALRFDDFKSAAAVWVNGHLVVLRGQPGDAGREEARLQSAIVPLPPGEPQVEVRVRLSNHFHHEGGIDSPVLLGELAALQQQAGSHQAIYLLVCGAALMMALFMLLIDRSAVRQLGGAPFAALLVLGCLRAASSGELLDEFLQLPALWVYRSEYLPAHLFAPVYGFLLLRLFPQEMSRRVLRLLWLVGGVGALLTLLLPPAFFTLLRDPVALWLMPCALYFIAVVVQAWHHRRPGATGILAGILLLDASVVNDLMVHSLNMPGINLIPLGILALLLSHGVVVGSRVMGVLLRNIELRQDLQRLNAGLEERIDARTRELASARDDALQQAQQTLERQAMLSHELRTPLVAIQGHLQLLDMASLPAPVQQRLGIVKVAAQSLTEVLDGLALLSRQERLGGEQVPSHFMPQRLAEECVAIFQPQARDKGLNLRLHCLPGLPQHVLGLPHYLRQVLYNLIGNALKFTRDGGISISLEPKGDGVQLWVSDTGPGISPALQEEVFKAFVRDPHTGQLGLGLGLYVVARLVELMRGRVELSSAPGQGTCIGVWLPLQTVDAPQSGVPAAALQGLRVLLVEDVEVSRQVTRELLQSWGCQVMTADCGAQAVAICARHEFDLVLMDVHLPDGNGLQVCRQIREEAGEWAPRIVALTASAAELLPDDWRAAGMQAVLSKPLSRMALSALLGADVPDTGAVAPRQADTPPCRSNARLDALRDWLGAELFERLRPQLVSSLREVGKQLQALGPGDESERSRLCHRLRGSALNFGLDELAAACQGVRTPARLAQLLVLLQQQLAELEAGMPTAGSAEDCSCTDDSRESVPTNQGSRT